MFTLWLSLKTTIHSECAPDHLHILEKSDIKPHFKVNSIQFSTFTDTKMRKKSMEHTPRQEADSFSTVRLLGKWEVYYCFHRSPDLILSHLNPMYILTHPFFLIKFNKSLQSTSRSLKYFILTFPIKLCKHFYFPYACYTSQHPVPLM